ncbi:probable E3 SUMO-protein ligase RNF212 isoform X2 [Lepus europaeus]|uniref:probable E3 SUMO-protein ligase RNF212 isoform X2 n=1 Tax=Lepus europaeus TaxID=9983 RepID=UPI002B476C62|nr:probable E3 SUMO-protein ligase RNF212 isoform X2 [Lepus europaeus]
MAGWVFCNRCFQPPRSKSRFSLTNCGHVYCDGCRGQGKKDECLICKVPCRTVFLSKNTDAEIQAFFMGIDSLCRKYSQETSQISEFQEKHRRRLLAFYREKISKLEESLRKLVLQIEQLQSVRSSQQTAFGTVRTSVPPAPARPRGCLLLPTGSSAPDRVESMEVDLTPSPVRRPQPEVAAGPTRMSLISPPQDGRMGSVSYRGPQHLGLTPHQTHLSKALRHPLFPLPTAWTHTGSLRLSLGKAEDPTIADPPEGTRTDPSTPGSRQSSERRLPWPRWLPGGSAQAAHQHLRPAA